MCYSFFSRFLRQIGMLKFTVLDSFIQALDASIQVFICSFRMGLCRFRMFGDSLSTISFSRSLRMRNCLIYMAFLGISAKRAESQNDPCP
jgi:hypothetical protein